MVDTYTSYHLCPQLVRCMGVFIYLIAGLREAVEKKYIKTPMRFYILNGWIKRNRGKNVLIVVLRSA